MGAYRFLRVHVHATEQGSGRVGADGDGGEVDGAMLLADCFEGVAVASVTSEPKLRIRAKVVNACVDVYIYL